MKILCFLLAFFLCSCPAYAAELPESEVEVIDLVPGFSDVGDTFTIHADQVILQEELQPFNVLTSPVSGGCFMEVSSSIGHLKIYVPSDFQRGSFSYFDGDNVTGIRSSTINGYAFKGSTLYQVRFPPFSDPEYRLYDSGYSYSDFSISSVNDTNIQILTSDSDLPLYPSSQMLQLLILAFLGVMLVWLFMRR